MHSMLETPYDARGVAVEGRNLAGARERGKWRWCVHDVSPARVRTARTSSACSHLLVPRAIRYCV
ncbi:MAG: hypothetical protein DMD35_14775 [Gemmatimonadetes bacterium]|nr:MAG: hypothetical protein DMD35_14775 [Gemmatimonadota bacterium]